MCTGSDSSDVPDGKSVLYVCSVGDVKLAGTEQARYLVLIFW